MKRTFITFISALVLFLASSEQLCAQHSMLEGNPVWVYQQEVAWDVKDFPANVNMSAIYEPLAYFFHIYYVKGDTTIQNRAYKKLYHEYIDINGAYAFGTNGAELISLLREDGDKILAPRSFYQKQWGDADRYYELVGSTDDEIVVYDFDAFRQGKVSLEQKNEIFTHFIENQYQTTLVDKTSRKVYSLGEDENAVQVIDRIGCSQNNVMLYAPFADDAYLVPDEVEAEMKILINMTDSTISMYPTGNSNGETSPRFLICLWDWGACYFFVKDVNQLSVDDTWVRTAEDGKMMVTMKKSSTFSFLGYYVKNGKIVYHDKSHDTRDGKYGYGAIERYEILQKYLNYSINDEEEMVDLGLSVKWSTHNVGATSPTDYGQYFCWGDTIGINRPSDYLQSVAYSGHYFEFEKRLQTHIAKTKFDAAYQLQGKNWRMPTVAEYQELINRCASVEISVDGVAGFLLTGPNGNTLFLPKAEGMEQTRDGMTLSRYFYDDAIYWTEDLIEDSRGHKADVEVYYNNQLDIVDRYDNQHYPLKALPIRAVYDESGDKWLDVKEYLYYEHYDLIEWGWNENDIVIPTIEACNDFIARHQEMFGDSAVQYSNMIRKRFVSFFRKHVTENLETYKSRAVYTYEGSDGKTLYFVDQIDDELLDVIDAQLGQIDLLSYINTEEDVKGNGAYTKNCTYTMENLDPKFGVPGNQYLHAIPTTQAAQPYIAFNLPSLLANTNYTIRITMAPEGLESVEPQGNQFRINMFIKNADGQWPKSRNFVCKNPLDPTGKELNFTSSADTLTVIDIPLTLTYSSDVMVQLQSYVSSAETKTYTRHLRIANIEIIKQDTQNNENVQNDSLAQYLPFVEQGKRWNVVRSDWDGRTQFDHFMLTNEKVEKDGKTYMKLYRSEDGLTVDYDAGLLREENRKVYFFDIDMQKEFLVFDYSLMAGDTLETYSYDESKMVSYKVLSVNDYTEGPMVIRYNYDTVGDSLATYSRYLRKWVVCRTDNNNLKKTWIEGVGSLEGPLANLYDSSPVSSRSSLAYVESDNYLPFSFYNEFSQVHGCGLPTGKEDNWEEDYRHKLTYELEGNRLHVYGEVYTQCGPNNYAYFIDVPTDDSLVHKIKFVIQEVEPTMDCMALHATNFYVSGFNPNLNYIIVDNHGEEHPVIIKTPQMAYRPFVEDGKVWMVKVISDGWPKEEWIDYYYFDGDTIIGGQLSKRMMCVKGDHIEYKSPENIESVESGKYIGAWYEQDKKVYFASNHQEQFELLYDFTLSTGDSIQNPEGQLLLVNKASEGIPGFKGTYYKIGDINVERWLEGVGSETFPHANFSWNGNMGALIACCVGDEVIYFNEQLADKLSYDNPAYAKKRRFDFNHTIKTQPKAPERRAEAVALYGEYNDQLLDINLNPLDEAYLVRITDNAGKVVYEKVVNASTIVALNIDISKYPEGQYEITIDNSNETFSGIIDTAATGIAEIINGKSSNSKSIYNLQGQRINAPQKGLNIMDGKKIFVK